MDRHYCSKVAVYADGQESMSQNGPEPLEQPTSHLGIYLLGACSLQKHGCSRSLLRIDARMVQTNFVSFSLHRRARTM